MNLCHYCGVSDLSVPLFSTLKIKFSVFWNSTSVYYIWLFFSSLLFLLSNISEDIVILNVDFWVIFSSSYYFVSQFPFCIRNGVGMNPHQGIRSIGGMWEPKCFIWFRYETFGEMSCFDLHFTFITGFYKVCWDSQIQIIIIHGYLYSDTLLWYISRFLLM